MQALSPKTRALRAAFSAVLGIGFLGSNISDIADGKMRFRGNPVPVTPASDPFTFWLWIFLFFAMGVIALWQVFTDVRFLWHQRTRAARDDPAV